MRRLALAFAVVVSVAAYPCMPVIDSGKPVPVKEEKVILIWDAEKKTEHFIRTAQFATNAKDLGFLVPVPTTPTFVEVDPKVFSVVSQQTNMKGGERPAPGSASSPASSVKVVKQQKVAGYKVSVLSAKSETALLDWLKSNGYPAPAAIKSWLKVYVKKGYQIAAFKYAGSSEGRIETRPVRMTFKHDRLFYPYREREDARAVPGRRWKAYVLSSEPMTALQTNGAKWRGFMGSDIEVTAKGREELAKYAKLPKGSLDKMEWMVICLDNAEAPRAKADLMFVPAKKLTASQSGFGRNAGRRNFTLGLFFR